MHPHTYSITHASLRSSRCPQRFRSTVLNLDTGDLCCVEMSGCWQVLPWWASADWWICWRHFPLKGVSAKHCDWTTRDKPCTSHSIASCSNQPADYRRPPQSAELCWQVSLFDFTGTTLYRDPCKGKFYSLPLFGRSKEVPLVAVVTFKWDCNKYLTMLIYWPNSLLLLQNLGVHTCKVLQDECEGLQNDSWYRKQKKIPFFDIPLIFAIFLVKHWMILPLQASYTFKFRWSSLRGHEERFVAHGRIQPLRQGNNRLWMLTGLFHCTLYREIEYNNFLQQLTAPQSQSKSTEPAPQFVWFLHDYQECSSFVKDDHPETKLAVKRQTGGGIYLCIITSKLPCI